MEKFDASSFFEISRLLQALCSAKYDDTTWWRQETATPLEEVLRSFFT